MRPGLEEFQRYEVNPEQEYLIMINKIRLLICFLLTSMFCANVHAAAISGRVSLPAGETAPVGGLRIFYQAFDLTATEPFQSAFATIPAGGTFVDFTLANVPNNNAAMWRVAYACAANITEGCLDYVQNGFYRAGVAGTTTYVQADATPVLDGTSGVDLTLLEGTTFSGTLTLPTGDAPAGGVDYRIFMQNSNLAGISNNAFFNIAENTSTGTFRITMPNDSSQTFVARYECPNVPSKNSFCRDNFVRNGFFNSSVGGNTVDIQGNGESLAGNTDRDDINMTFLTGARISGTVFLPSGTAPAGGVTVVVSAQDQSNSNLPALQIVTIPQNASSVPYFLNVPDDGLASWRVTYSCNPAIGPGDCSAYFPGGYYDADDLHDTTSGSLADADLLAGGANHMPINLTLIEPLAISGRITIDSGASSPEGGLTLTVSVQDAAGGGTALFSDFAIPEGDSEVPFSIQIPDSTSTSWRLGYDCKDPGIQVQCAGYQRFGFYDADSPGSTTMVLGESDLLQGGISHINLPLTVFPLPDEAADEICFPVSRAVICL